MCAFTIVHVFHLNKYTSRGCILIVILVRRLHNAKSVEIFVLEDNPAQDQH